MRTSGLIVAAGMSSRMKEFKPMMEIKSLSMIKRIITTMQQAGTTPIVVITGYQGDRLEEHLAHMDVICLRNPAYETTEMFDSVKIGFQYLQGKCDRIVFTPTDVPLFTVDSVRKLMDGDTSLAKPVCNGKGGHPILIHQSILPFLLEYNGEGGLKEALKGCGVPLDLIEVKDEGVLYDADTQIDYIQMVNFHRNQRKDINSKHIDE